LDGKILWFEMITHPPDKSARWFSQGWATMRAGKNHVTIGGTDYPGATSAWTVTLSGTEVAKFKPNDAKTAFHLRGEDVTPDYLYIVATARDG
jgi:hypothetical protein